MHNVTVSVLVKELEAYKLCGGVNASGMTSKLYHHMSFLWIKTWWWMRTVSSSHTRDIGYQRAACSFVNRTLYVWLVVSTRCLQEVPVMQRRDDSWNLPMLRHRCQRQTQKELSWLCGCIGHVWTLQGQRLRCAELERELNEMRAEIVKTNIEVDHELSNDFSKILTVTTRFVSYSHKINFFQTSFQSGFSEIMFSLQKNILCR